MRINKFKTFHNESLEIHVDGEYGDAGEKAFCEKYGYSSEQIRELNHIISELTDNGIECTLFTTKSRLEDQASIRLECYNSLEGNEGYESPLVTKSHVFVRLCEEIVERLKITYGEVNEYLGCTDWATLRYDAGWETDDIKISDVYEHW